MTLNLFLSSREVKMHYTMEQKLRKAWQSNSKLPFNSCEDNVGEKRCADVRNREQRERKGVCKRKHGFGIQLPGFQSWVTLSHFLGTWPLGVS